MDRYEAEYEEIASAIIFWKSVLERQPDSIIVREQLASLEARADRLAEEINP